MSARLAPTLAPPFTVTSVLVGAAAAAVPELDSTGRGFTAAVLLLPAG